MSQPSNTASSHYDSATFSTTLRDLVQGHLVSLCTKLSSTPRFSSHWLELAVDYRSTLSTLDELSLQARNNSYASPVATLPTEILLDIFAHVVETERPRPPLNKQNLALYERYIKPENERVLGLAREPEFLSDKGGRLGWLTLGHVSSFWRRTLLAQSRFWAREIGSLPLGISTILSRAGDAPLTLHSYRSYLRKSQFNDLLVATLLRNNSTLIQRVRELNVVNACDGDLGEYILQHEFPQLDTLRVYGSECCYMSHTVKAPALRKACFTNIIPTIESSALCDVVVNQRNTRPFVLAHFMQDLQNLLRTFAPSFTRLKILDVLADDSPSSDDSSSSSDSLASARNRDSQIYLPEMRHLQIASTSANNTVPLLRGVAIKLPETALLSLSIDFKDYAEENELRDDIYALVFAAHVNELSLTGVAILDTDNYNDATTHRVDIELYTTPATALSERDPPSGPFTGQIRRLSLHFQYESSEREWSLDIFLNALASCTSLRTADTLSYQGCCHACAPIVDPTLLARFPNVRTLHLADAHSRCSRVMNSLCGTSPALPGLECLWLTQRSDEHVLQREILAQQLLRRCDALRDAAPEGAARLKRLLVDRAVGLDESEDSQRAQISLIHVVNEIRWSL